MQHLIAYIGAFFLDLLIGDPYFLPHPVRLMGRSIKLSEKVAVKFAKKDNKKLFISGCFIVIFNILVFACIYLSIIIISYKINTYFGIIIESVAAFQLLAAKSLKDESMKVYYSLKDENIEAARKNLSMIVGRDTDMLDEKGIIKAAVETVAENFSDGVAAPLFYIFIGGAALGAVYKVINTMDSMLGYKNEKYLYLGKAAAKLDDVVNFIPARLSVLFMCIAGIFLNLDIKNGINTFFRDRYKHASPNSAQTESFVAGALNVELAGDAYYFGKLYKKDKIGRDIREIKIKDIKTVNALMYLSTTAALIFFSLIYIYMMKGKIWFIL